MKEIVEIKPFTTEFELVHLPACRIIGKEIRNGGKLGNTAPKLWDEVYSTNVHSVLEKLPHLISKDLFGWTCEYDSETDTFIYIVCALTPMDTKVPDGFTYRDIPETICAKGLYGEDVGQTLQRAEKVGYQANWEKPGCGWNAEMYFHEEEENPPMESATQWHWLIPVVEMAK
ncbi:effector binding domain-containing protein [Anaerosporobacter faecicola]|uniref:effector binding domain-containing protein n=1 Tax=Anaerosporobacter faecicola TaxID=2718714 RepID=UPI00143904E4|nr:effector binding domain-containing protein [Anaerosporobacter faecicola]